VSSGGALGGTTIVDGGLLVLSSGATGAGVMFANPTTLQIGGTSIPSGLVISGFAVGDVIDLTSIAFSSSGTTSVAGSVLTISEGGKT
jgi:hypothetical protein